MKIACFLLLFLSSSFALADEGYGGHVDCEGTRGRNHVLIKTSCYGTNGCNKSIYLNSKKVKASVEYNEKNELISRKSDSEDCISTLTVIVVKKSALVKTSSGFKERFVLICREVSLEKGISSEAIEANACN